jgi:hypothetical protein
LPLTCVDGGLNPPESGDFNADDVRQASRISGPRRPTARVAPGRHAVLLVDQAAWHLSEGLIVPANITIVPLPAKCPELNAQENVWQFLRDNWLSNRVFASYDAIVDHCCHAWNKLVAQPWKIMSLGHLQGRRAPVDARGSRTGHSIRGDRGDLGFDLRPELRGR